MHSRGVLLRFIGRWLFATPPLQTFLEILQGFGFLYNVLDFSMFFINSIELTIDFLGLSFSIINYRFSIKFMGSIGL